MARRARSRSLFAIDWPQRANPYSSTPKRRGPPQPEPEERIRRNVACVNCRNSKVKCRISETSGQPCQRCARLELSCVVDKSHKRITKRSKLELLEQELRSIKEAVVTNDSTRPSAPSSDAARQWTPPSPRSSGVSAHPEVITQAAICPSGRERLASAEAQLTREQTAAPRRDERPEAKTPASSRTLRGHVISGEDVDVYFDRYRSLYHPYLPIVTQANPDTCFQKSKTLFYTILYVASRRFTRDLALQAALGEELCETPWLMLSATNLTLEHIHALLLLANWPLPGVRLLADPTPTLLNIAMVACMQLGLHTGRGRSLQFICAVRPEAECTDEEASSTWLACCLLLSKTSTQAGLPPPLLQYSDRACLAALQNPKWRELIASYELQKWMNRFHTAMAAEMGAHETIAEETVARWESEFDLLEPTFRLRASDMHKLAIIASRLEIRCYRILTPPIPLPPSYHHHYISVFHSTHQLLAGFDALPQHHKDHHPLSLSRSLVVASAIRICALQQRTICCPALSDAAATDLARQAWQAVRRCGIVEGDSLLRVSSFMEMFWSLAVCGGSSSSRGALEREAVPVQVWRERLGVGVAFGCLRRMKKALIDAKKIQADGFRDGERVSQASAPAAAAEGADEPATGTGSAEAGARADGMATGGDPFLGADWSFLMDGLDWNAGSDSFFMGLI